MRLFILIVVLIGVVAYQNLDSSGGLDHLPPRRLADNEPLQERLEKPKSIIHKKYRLDLLHKFSMTALVLSREWYSFDRESDVSPVDLALGWGPMSNPLPLQSIRIRQGSRYYYYRYKNPPPISKHEIALNSANMHMIPANDEVERVLKKAKTGRLVQLSGYLVNVYGDDGFNWHSSTTRSDTGKGACEIIYVENARVVEP